ncbi:MAG: arsenate reductase family protein [Candidatus Eremiobacteraeota bacterium]|nr:arsenate reductase family protein [Candidatus Eremiobacteraeota bacterium]MCW5872113.1 arsenate reductase family protein [Candidatus Eremiobacteraeota bacterium]
MKVYAYKNCSTCQKALRFLQGRSFELVDIVEQPPTLAELRRMSGYVGGVRKLFNTSGRLYRELGLAGRNLDDEEALRLLAGHGKLVKRPFLLTSQGGAVGFRPEAWSELLDKGAI